LSTSRPTSGMLLSLAAWIGEEHPQGCKNSTRVFAMNRHAEPISRFLPPDVLDPFGDEAHRVPTPHWRKRPKQESQPQRGFLSDRRPHSFKRQDIDADSSFL